jgi:hypothetical protein
MIGVIADMIQYVADLSKKWPTVTLVIELVILAFTALVSLLISVGIALLGFTTAAGTAATGATALAGGLTALAGGSAGLATAGAAFSEGMIAAAPGLGIATVVALGFGAAIMMIGIGAALTGFSILLMAAAVALLIYNLKDLSLAQGAGILAFFAVLTIIAYGMIIPFVILGSTFTIFAPGLILFSFAILAVGAAISGVVLSVSSLIEKFTMLYSLFQGPQVMDATAIVALSDAMNNLEGKELVINVRVTGDLDRLDAIKGLTVTAASAPAGAAPAGASSSSAPSALAQPDTVKIEIKNMVVKVGDKDFATTIDTIMGEYVSSNAGKARILSYTAPRP